MTAFIVDLEDRPGAIAAVAEALAMKGISITSLAGVTTRGAGCAALITNDESGTRKALADARFNVREIEIVPHAIEDRPGSFAEVARKLADAGVNLEAVLPTGMSGGKVSIAFATKDVAKAREALGAMAAAGR
jgi:hypothetical protein